MTKPWIIGHLGAAGRLENTIVAFEHALSLGVDGIEFDVRRSGDGQLVVVHDSVVNNHSVQGTPYEKFRDFPNGDYVPLFEEVLEKFGKKTFLDIELKNFGGEEQAVELIKRYTNPEQTMVSAFNSKSLQLVHDLLPEVQLGFIYNKTQDEESRHHCPIDVVIPQFRLASRQLIEDVHDEGLKVWAWTVNDEAEIRRLLNLNVDGFITDYPELVGSALQR